MDAIIVWLIVTSLIFQIAFILLFTFKLSKPQGKQFGNSLPKPISVIICARNEVNNLKKYLPFVVKQDYPNFEVIVVDDASTDGSLEFLASLQETVQHLKVVSISPSEKTTSGKKQALVRGVENASNEILVLTDADCKPMSNRWLHHMSVGFSDKIEIILGYSPMLQGGKLSDLLARYENLLTATLYLNFAVMGLPYMGVGRNLAYRKSLIERNIGEFNFSITGGDDDLMVNKLAAKNNTTVCLDNESWVETHTPVSIVAYFQQKRRHIAVSGYYKPTSIAILSIWNLSKLISYLGLFFLTCQVNTVDKWVWIVFAVYLSVLYLGAAKNIKVLGNRELIFLVPVLDALSVFFNSFVVLTNLFSRKSGWK